MKPLRSVLFAAATVLLSQSRLALAGADEITPLFQPPSWSTRVGQAIELTLPARLVAPVVPGDIRMVFRGYGAQELIEPQAGEKGGPLAWRCTPRRAGACIVATAIEPSSFTGGERTFRYEKLFLRVGPEDSAAAPVVKPSASAIARFAQRLELCPMVDPTCLLIGADLPIRVKFEGTDLKGATVIAKVELAGAVPPKTLTFTTNDSAAVNVPIRTSGLWTITIEHRPDASDQDNRDRFVATMMFVVEEGSAVQTDLDGSRPAKPAAPQGGPIREPRPKSRDHGAIGPAWEEWGPAPTAGDSEYTGRVSALVCSPTNANKYFVGGADGGVWRTTDGGASWTPLTDDLPTTAIGALTLDPTNENVIYAGTGEANFAYHSRFGLGILKSTDGGDTWVALAESTFAGRCISRILVDPSNPLIVYAGVTPAGGFIPPRGAAKGHPQANDPVGVYQSLDGGVMWARLTNGLPSLAATDLAMQPGSPQVLYAAIGHIFGDATNGIYKSINAGQSWTKLAGGLPTTDVGRISIAVAPSMPQRLYAAIAGAATSTGDSAELRGVYRTDNGGTTWAAVSPANYMVTYGWYLNVVSVRPTDANVVIVGGLSLLRSTNAGSNWTDTTPPHVDQHALAWDAAGRLLAGDDGGVHRSADLGNSWTPLNDGLGIFQFYAGISLHPTQTDTLFGGTQDNGTNRRTGPDVWTQVFGGDGGYTAINQTTPNVVFCEYQGTGNLYRSINLGDSFNLSSTGITTSDRNCFLPPFEIAPSDSQRMVYGSHRVYQSTNGGLNWATISGDLTAGSPAAIHSLAISPANPQTIWATTSDGRVQVTFNGGTQWNLVRQNLPGWFRVMRQVFASPDSNQTAYLAGSAFGTDQVLRTTNGGAAWTPLDGNLPDVPVNTIAVDVRPTVDVLYAGTEIGIYRSVNGGTAWHRYGQGFPNTAVIDLRLDVAHGRLLAGTQGRGLWRIDVWLPGDVNGDGLANLDDISTFVDVLLGLDTDLDHVNASDIDASGAVNGLDIQPFVNLLLSP